MTDRVSRIVFLVELLVLALPATVVFVVLLLAFFHAYLMLSDVGPLSSEAETPPWTAYLTLAAPALFALGFSAFWVLAARFLVAGRESLARASTFLWVLVFLGQGIALAVALPSLVGDAGSVIMSSLAPVTGLIFFLFPSLLHMLVVLPRNGGGAIQAK